LAVKNKIVLHMKSRSPKYLSCILLLLLVLGACKKASLQVAEERFIVGTLTIKATPQLSLLLGKDSALVLVMTPDKVSNNKLIWETSDAAVVSVTETGKIKALKLGTATVTVRSTDGGARTASVAVTVIDHIDFMTTINFNTAAVSIFVTETQKVEATVLPANATYKTLKWTSSNTAVATVSEEGIVTGIAKGTATVTATAIDGSGVNRAVPVEVKEVVPVTGVTLQAALTEPIAIGELFPLGYTVTPTGASVQLLKWTSSNPAVATVSASGVVEGKTAGQVTITVTATNNTAITADISVTVDDAKLNDVFATSKGPWILPTALSSGIIDNGKYVVTMAKQSSGKYRGDFQRTGGAIVHAGKYPIIAIKFNRPVVGNVIFDTGIGSFLNGNNKLTTLTGKDGVQVHYADIAAGSFGAGSTKLSTTANTTLSPFQFKIADIVLTDPVVAAGGDKYGVYWVKSFASLAALQAFINK
jgi:uncharacterized protein YjdB